MKGKAIVFTALRALNHTNGSGAVDENRESRYFGIAPAFLTLLQNEIAARRGDAQTPAPLASLADDLALDDDTAARVLPAGLAMLFALADRDGDVYNHFSQLYYGSLLPSVQPGEVLLADSYGVRNDGTFQ